MYQRNDNDQPPVPASLIQLVTQVTIFPFQLAAAQLISSAWYGSMAERICHRRLTLADAIHRSTAVLDAAVFTFVACMSEDLPAHDQTMFLSATMFSFAVSTHLIH